MSDQSKKVVAHLQSLAATLERSPRVRRRAVGEGVSTTKIAMEAADSLVDIRRSAQALAKVLPTLFSQPPDSEAFEDALDDIGEELRHIYYHILNTKLFDHVVGSF